MTLLWIVVFGLLMCSISLIGALTAFLPEHWVQKLLLPLVALAAGSLLGGALFHMLPEGVELMGGTVAPYVSCALGFATFFALDQFLHWHHCHDIEHAHVQPVTKLLLIADGVHNLLGGLAVGAAFVTDLGLGITTWMVAAAHEVPQELGDYGVLVHGGYARRRALWLNFLSSLPFVLGGVAAWAIADVVDVSPMLPFAAGNFLYIAGADLIPEVKRHADLRTAGLYFVCLLAGAGILLAAKLLFDDHATLAR